MTDAELQALVESWAAWLPREDVVKAQKMIHELIELRHKRDDSSPDQNQEDA